jgi:hypothetical protein
VRCSIVALFREVGHERSDEALFVDPVENVRSMHEFCGDVGRRSRRRTERGDFAQAETSARELAVIGGRKPGGVLVLCAHLLQLAGGFRRAAAPVSGARENDRIGRAFINAGEVLKRGGRVVEEAQRDPSGHEVEVGAVIGIGRNGGLVHDTVGGPRVAGIEELAGEDAPLTPPFVGVLPLQILRRSREHQLDRRRNILLGRHDMAANIGAGQVVAQVPVQAAQCVAKIGTDAAGNITKQRPGLGRFRLRATARLDDRNVVVADMFCCAHCRAEIAGADAAVHPRHMIGAGQHTRECGEHGGFHFGRQLRRPPHRPHPALSVGAVAFFHFGTGQRQPARHADRLADDESAYRAGVVPPLPQLLLDAPPQHRNARPVGIGADEGGVAREADVSVRLAQQDPFHQLLRQRIADGCRNRACVTELVLVDQLDRLFCGSEFRRHRRGRTGCSRTFGRQGNGVGILAVVVPRAGAPFRI